MAEDSLNYYLILDLDPSIDDWAEIDKRLEEKRRKWGRDATMGAPAVRRKAEHYMKILDDIVAALKDPETRREIAREAKRQLEQQKQDKLEELNRYISVLKAEGRYSKEQVKDVHKRLGGDFTEKEIEDRIKAAGILPEGSGTEQKKPPKEQLPTEDKNLIRRNLDFLKITNLYQLLDESPRVSCKDLRDKADESNRELLRMGKTDPESNAKKELYGLCIKVFSSEDGKKKYENTLELESMDGMKNLIDMAGSDNFISIDKMDVLVNQAREKGVQPEDARDYILEYAERKKWKVQRTEKLPSSELLLCGFCSTLAKDPKATHCSECGEPLHIECPRCHAQNPTQNMACTKCGFNTGCAPVVKSLFKQGQQLAVEGDFVKSIQCFDRALLYWPDWSDLLDAKRNVEKRHKEREAILDKIRTLIRSWKFMEAESALERFQGTYGSVNIESIQQQVQRGIERAQSLFEQGESLRRTGKVEEAFDKYAEALQICTDLDKARIAMASCPPPPPPKLVVTPLASGFRLVWQSVKSRWEIGYVIVRKANGLPTSDTDGICAGKVESSTFDDTDVESGTPWYYAVYTSRNGIVSREAAQSGPHLAISEVEELEVRAGDSEITLSWKMPKGCQRVEVWRQMNALPTQPGDGEQIPISGSSVQDTGLKNGVSYGYMVVAVFKDPVHQGKEIFSSGIRHKAVPVAPPKPVEDLKYSRNKETVILTWTPIPGANVQIRQTENLADYTPGLMISLQQANRFGKLVPITSNNRAQVTITKQGRTFFVPITFVVETAVVGKAVSLTTVEDVTALKSQTVGKNIALFWKWPEGINETLVCFAYDGFVEDPVNSHATKARVTRQQYDRNGCWELRNAESKRHYFTVFTKAPNLNAYSQGARIIENLGQTLAARYRVVLKKNLLTRSTKEAWVELECDGVSTLPSRLCVVGKKRNTPVSPNDGVLIAEVGQMKFNDGTALIPIERKYWGSDLYLRLFFKDPESNKEIRLLPADKNNLKLG